MDKLLAQLKLTINQLITVDNSYYCFEENVEHIKAKVFACIRLISQDSLSTTYLKDINDEKKFVSHLLNQTQLSIEQLEILLPIVLTKLCNKSQDIINAMLQHETLQHLALSIALQNQYQIQLPQNCSMQVLQHHCINLFLMNKEQELKHYHHSFCNAKCQQTQVLLKILMKQPLTLHSEQKLVVNETKLVTDIFKIYILSLDEIQLTNLINDLSKDEDNYPLLIAVMGVSGFIKYVPFLAKALFNKAVAKAAFDYLKLMLGDKLAAFMPLALQFESNEQQQYKSLHYYGAKILHLWSQRNTDDYPDKMLSGVAINQKNLNVISTTHSLRHKKHALLLMIAQSFNTSSVNHNFRLII